MKPHWYLTYTIVCPLCSNQTVNKLRQYTPKPKDASKRYEYHEAWDGCGV